MNHRLSFKVLAVWGVTKRGTVIARLLLTRNVAVIVVVTQIYVRLYLSPSLFTAHQLSSIHFARIFLGIALHRCGDVGWRRDLWADHHITSKEREHAAPFAEAATTMSATSKEPKPVAQRTVMSVPLAIRVALMMSDDLFQWLWWQFSLEFAEIALQL